MTTYYTKFNAVSVAVGIIEQSIIAPFTTRGEDFALIVVENTSAVETFDGRVWASPNGINGWAVEENDAFAGIQPLKSRRLVLSSDRIFLRMLGNFVAGPSSVLVSVLQLHNVGWAPNTLSRQA